MCSEHHCNRIGWHAVMDFFLALHNNYMHAYNGPDIHWLGRLVVLLFSSMQTSIVTDHCSSNFLHGD